ncbi:MAG: tRNA lysidine(34) synthetase TilS [Candidatus Shikimatogenerans bostrichidophilus]|nr:MAG: tRNA lysidine(34) synthetase TilS [Candidatus Shikimatogenerans bostrichidophilus]
MLKKFKNYFLNNKWINKKFIIAVSGGLDSIILLNIFIKIFKRNIIVCNCNFNLSKDRKHNILVFNICYKNNLKLYFKDFNTLKYIKNKKYSIQMGARELRYKWFYKILKKNKYDYIVTGHHINDDIETFFINLLKGNSLFGLKGIKSINNKILRPYLILKINKEYIYKYAIKNNIRWIEDKSNIKNYYFRNNIRNNLIPYIKNVYNKYYNNIYNTLYKLKIESNILNNYIKYIYKNILKTKYILNIKYICIYFYKILKIKNYDYIIYRNLIKYGFCNFNYFININNKRKGYIIYSNSNKYKIIKDNKKLILFKNKKNKINFLIKKSTIININKNNKIIFKFVKNKNIIFNNKYIYLNLDLIILPIYIKNWRKGYKYSYKNKIIKINKIFKKLKISRFYKDKILFLVDSNNIILSSLNMIYIYNNNYIVNNNTKNILYYNFLFNLK